MAKFPAASNLKVDELIALYEGIIPEVEESLRDSAISDQLVKPGAPRGLDDLLEYGEFGDPMMPEDLTELDSVMLGKLFSFLTNWTNYVQSELTRAECILMVIERELEIIKAALMIYYKEDVQVPANQAGDRVDTDSRYVRADTAAYRTKIFVKKVKSRYDQYKKTIGTISREQTRRQAEFERERHESTGPMEQMGAKGFRRRGT
jgi:hypothetical protein